MTSHKYSLAAKTVSKWALQRLKLKCSSGKVECFVAIGKDDKSKLFGVAFSFNRLIYFLGNILLVQYSVSCYCEMLSYYCIADNFPQCSHTIKV